MNNASVNNKLIRYFIFGIIVIIIGFIIIILLSDKYFAIIIGLINLLIYIFINIIMNLNNADIYYDKLNNLIIIKNIFNEDH